MAETQPNIFEYVNYRDFLKAFYAFKKSENPHFSYRVFSRQTGFKSLTYLMMIVSGKRNLTIEPARKVAKACSLKDLESRYFLELVRFNQAINDEEKKSSLGILASLRMRNKTHYLNDEQLEIFKDWHAMVILEMTRMVHFEWNSQWIMDQLLVPTTQDKIKRSMNQLLDCGLVRLNGNRAEPTNELLYRGGDISSSIIRMYHSSILKAAEGALQRLEPVDREFQASSISIREEDIAEVKRRIREFHAQLNELAKTKGDADSVIQVNSQFFPMTKKKRSAA